MKTRKLNKLTQAELVELLAELLRQGHRYSRHYKNAASLLVARAGGRYLD